MINISYRSIPGMLKENVRLYAERTAVIYKRDDSFHSLSYTQFYQRVLMLARGLLKIGIKPGDRVAIFSENRLGWAISDFGIQSVRAVTVPIYATNTGDQAAYVINHSGARVVFVSTRMQYEKLLAVRDQIPGIEMVVSYERFLGDLSFPVYTQYQLSEVSYPLKEEEKQQVEDLIDAITPDDLITIIYTSGTTGKPKGVMLTQENVLFDAIAGSKKLAPSDRIETFLSFLPLSHVLERTGGYYAALIHGHTIAFAENVQKVMENMVEIKPTVMVSVPRLFEKIYSRVHENVRLMSPLMRALFNKAVEVGRRYVNLKYVQKKPTGLVGLQYRFFDRLIFSRVRARFGGRLQYFICGGAPLDKTINEFMWIIGLPVYAGYGLTETSPAVCLTSYDEVRFDSVGKAFEETELKLAEDGELMIRGPQVMKGYYKDQKATDETFENGWLMTGDIAKIDEEGFVYIVDRKKEIIITSGGKNIAPQPLENELRLDKFISQAMVFGDRKPYLVAVLTPNVERLLDLGRDEKLNYIDMEDLVHNKRIQEIYSERLAELNKMLPPYETIKRFVLLPRDFSVEGGELTPTLKLKRRRIYDMYQDKIEELYTQNNHPKSTNGGEK
jgi:long-chain acyl-CoA synthetase